MSIGLNINIPTILNTTQYIRMHSKKEQGMLNKACETFQISDPQQKEYLTKNTVIVDGGSTNTRWFFPHDIDVEFRLDSIQPRSINDIITHAIQQFMTKGGDINAIKDIIFTGPGIPYIDKDIAFFKPVSSWQQWVGHGPVNIKDIFNASLSNLGHKSPSNIVSIALSDDYPLSGLFQTDKSKQMAGLFGTGLVLIKEIEKSPNEPYICQNAHEKVSKKWIEANESLYTLLKLDWIKDNREWIKPTGTQMVGGGHMLHSLTNLLSSNTMLDGISGLTDKGYNQNLQEIRQIFQTLQHKSPLDKNNAIISITRSIETNDYAREILSHWMHGVGSFYGQMALSTGYRHYPTSQSTTNEKEILNQTREQYGNDLKFETGTLYQRPDGIFAKLQKTLSPQQYAALVKQPYISGVHSLAPNVTVELLTEKDLAARGVIGALGSKDRGTFNIAMQIYELSQKGLTSQGIEAEIAKLAFGRDSF